MAIFKYCRCGLRIEQHIRACDDCLVVIDTERKNRHKKYQSNRTDTKEQTFYNSKAWKKSRDRVKARDDCLCLYCFFIGKKIKGMEVVHHVKELKEDYDKRVDESNLISLCNDCHKKIIHKEYDKSSNDKKIMQKVLSELLTREIEI